MSNWVEPERARALAAMLEEAADRAESHRFEARIEVSATYVAVRQEWDAVDVEGGEGL